MNIYKELDNLNCTISRINSYLDNNKIGDVFLRSVYNRINSLLGRINIQLNVSDPSHYWHEDDDEEALEEALDERLENIEDKIDRIENGRQGVSRMYLDEIFNLLIEVQKESFCLVFDREINSVLLTHVFERIDRIQGRLYKQLYVTNMILPGGQVNEPIGVKPPKRSKEEDECECIDCEFKRQMRIHEWFPHKEAKRDRG